MASTTAAAIDVDPDGYMRTADAWTPDVALAMAAADGVVLTDDHWRIIAMLRDYWRERQVAPPLRIVVSLAGAWLGPARASRHLYALFPRGPARQGCRYAGLPKPPGCV
jgi:TusE/DsrC/DsvC family sulfur relay protein